MLRRELVTLPDYMPGLAALACGLAVGTRTLALALIPALVYLFIVLSMIVGGKHFRRVEE